MKKGEDSRRKALALAWFFTFCSSSVGHGLVLEPLDLLVDRRLHRGRVLAVLDHGLDLDDARRTS